jgi:aspartate/methionine/tyrosine aminotransferase
LLLVPGNVFSNRDTHFRISYAASDETLQRGMGILKELS